MSARGVDPAAVSTELLLGRMGRENSATKAMRYLIEGRVEIRAVGAFGVRAFVRGSGHLWNVAYEPSEGFTCDCPALTDQCAHIRAVQTVVIAPKGPNR